MAIIPVGQGVGLCRRSSPRQAHLYGLPGRGAGGTHVSSPRLTAGMGVTPWVPGIGSPAPSFPTRPPW